MSIGPPVIIAATEATTQADAHAICAELEDLGLSPSFRDSVERRGVGVELWYFILQTDWGVVRDTVIASGLAAGIPAGVKALNHAAKRLAVKFRIFRQKMPPSKGFFVIRDTKNGIELQLPADSGEDVVAWLKLLEHQAVITSLRWDEVKQEWVKL